MRAVGLIPARGGSKGIPRKNLVDLCGKPLLQYTAEAARASRLDRVVLSTDDPEIAELGRRCGIEVPFLRPAALAEDTTPMLPVVLHAIEQLEERGEQIDALCLLQPSSPLRTAADIDGALELLEESGADSVISFVAVGGHHPARMKIVTGEGLVVDPPFAEAYEGQRRQDLMPLYLREGSIYLTRRDVLVEHGSFKGNSCRAWIVPRERACNIDSPFDLRLAQCLLSPDGSH